MNKPIRLSNKFSKSIKNEAKSVSKGFSEDTEVKYNVKFVVKLFREQQRFSDPPEPIKKLGSFKGSFVVDDADLILDELGKRVPGWSADDSDWWKEPTKAGKVTSNPFWVTGNKLGELHYVSPKDRDKEIEKVVNEWKKILDANKIEWKGFKGYDSLPKLPNLPNLADKNVSLPPLPVFNFCQVVFIVIKDEETKITKHDIMTGPEIIDELGI